MLALGFCSSDSVPVLLEEIQGLIEEYSSTRTSVSAQALEVTSLNGPLWLKCPCTVVRSHDLSSASNPQCYMLAISLAVHTFRVFISQPGSDTL